MSSIIEPTHQSINPFFAENIAPVCNVIINGIYWDERYPRLLTKKEMSNLYEQGKKRYA